MKWATLFLGVVLLCLSLLAFWKGDGVFQAGISASLKQSKKLLPLMLVAFFIAGFVEVLLPTAFVERWLSDASGWKGIVVAWIAGGLTPAGSLVGIPIAATIYKAGAGLGVVMTYLTSLALLSMIRFPLEIGVYGIKLTLIRVGVSFFLPPIAGIITLFFVQKLQH